MVWVAPGPFWMGCNSVKDKECSKRPNESPQHEVVLSGYWLDKHEVTVSAYGACVSAGKRSKPDATSSYCNWGKPDYAQHPVNCVTWSQARAYCQWLGSGYDLPTEAQWEKGARGGCEHNGGVSGCKVGMRTYPWGDATASCSYAVMYEGGSGCGKKSTWAVGSKPQGVSPYGAHDMAGNVLEWCLDWYRHDYYDSSVKNDPMNNQSASDRVVRGGSKVYSAVHLRSGYRGNVYPALYYTGVGFRCAR